MKNNLSDVNNYLFEQLERLNDDDYRLKINLLCVVKNVSVLGLFTML